MRLQSVEPQLGEDLVGSRRTREIRDGVAFEISKGEDERGGFHAVRLLHDPAGGVTKTLGFTVDHHGAENQPQEPNGPSLFH